MRKKLGIIGGMGPEATSFFYQEIIAHTVAERDQDHLDMVILNHSSMPDRTKAILSGDHKEILEALIKDARDLEYMGAAHIAVPCNTSHYFLDQVQREVGIPILHMVRKSAEYAAKEMTPGGKVGILGTEGTIQSGIYHRECRMAGIEPVTVPEDLQAGITSLIYEDVKGGRTPDGRKLENALSYLREKGCEKVILACTELSVFQKKEGTSPVCLDAMDVLVREAILASGAEYR
ncbi:aspartate/glutamate racemase family protein [Suipraeoptans intestinalis]|uniref:aspartate/glutamate racemase family protein n=1 Tax=Suipraeoptans intestinalis TaxID=2606628 RepID=UPI0023F15F24|nr:amino acid racemase [Suipraeoptans intestinalis]MDD7769577.1 amino acid racemase [Suipraeoptans intestinalis]MDY3121434.1 amino acid racemase [Suipraeoptans intestinalis]